MFIQENISAPCTLLDFPDPRSGFAEEIATETRYDIIGISSIVMNLGKVREMCRLIRASRRSSTIVVGGHVAAFPATCRKLIDADHIVRGEGVDWMRAFPGRRPERAGSATPTIVSGFGRARWA